MIPSVVMMVGDGVVPAQGSSGHDGGDGVVTPRVQWSWWC